jgi:hypothetical protein
MRAATLDRTVRRRAVFVAMGLAFSVRPGLAEAPVEWARETASPRPSDGSSARDPALAPICAETDAALGLVAKRLASHRIVADDVEGLVDALRAAGEPHVWPRAMALEGRVVDRVEARARIDRWLAAFRRRGRLRCAIASATDSGRETVAVVAVDAQADLEPIATVVRPASWVDVDARVLVPASAAKLVVLGPSGPPRTVPTSLVAGRVRSRANLDRAGAWKLQLVVDGDGGPRPVLEAIVFAGVAPRARLEELAPGEGLAASGDDADALANMIAEARASEGLGRLRSSRMLDRLARAHAERMMRASELGHDVGDGDVRRRLEDAGIDAASVGENVAHAATLALAHRALWASPSHRDNLLGPRFDRVGVGVTRDADGTVWVAELFASPP